MLDREYCTHLAKYIDTFKYLQVPFHGIGIKSTQEVTYDIKRKNTLIQD